MLIRLTVMNLNENNLIIRRRGMSYLVDLIFVLLIGVSTYMGYKKGFIKTFVSLVVKLLSFIVALLFATPVSLLFADKILTDYPEVVSKAAAYTIAFIIIYILANIGITIAANVLDIIAKLPFLNFANKTLGIAAGAVLGLISAWIFAIALNFVFPLLTEYNSELFTNTLLDDSLLFDIIYNINIFKDLFAKICS